MSQPSEKIDENPSPRSHLTLAEQLQQALEQIDTLTAERNQLMSGNGHLILQVQALTAERDQLKAGGAPAEADDEDDEPEDAPVDVVDTAVHEAAVAALTTERDQLKATNEVLLGKVADLIAANDLLEKNQRTAEELSRRQLMQVGQPPVGCDATGGKKDQAKMTLTERCQADIAAKQAGDRFRTQ